MQSYGTAWFALHDRAPAVAGSGCWCSVPVAASGWRPSTSATQWVCTSSPRPRPRTSAALARARGAEAVIDSSTEDVKARAREIGDGDGVDLVYDPVGGTQGEQALRALRDDGQFLVIGFASGAIPKLPANQVLLRNRRVTGVEWGGWVAKNPAANADMLGRGAGVDRAGELHPVEPVAYPLERAADALQDQLDRKITGKTVLVP